MDDNIEHIMCVVCVCVLDVSSSILRHWLARILVNRIEVYDIVASVLVNAVP